MTRFDGPKAALMAAQSPDASAELLDELAASEYPFVRAAVASHTATRPETLRILMPVDLLDDRAAAIARALARNPQTPADALRTLGAYILPQLGEPRDRPWAFDLGVSLCANPATPSETVQAIIGSPRALQQFRKVVARETSRPDVLDVLRSDRSEVVRAPLRRIGDPNPVPFGVLSNERCN